MNDLTNILLNLSKDEVNILKEKYRETWFETLGYSQPKYIKPKFE